MDATKGPEDVVTVDVHSAKKLLDSGHRFLDVRMNEEFNKGHINHAVNIHFMFITEEGNRVKNPDFVSQVSSVLKEDQLVEGCMDGNRGSLACVDRLNAGHKQVMNMEGGFVVDLPETNLLKSSKLRASFTLEIHILLKILITTFYINLPGL